MPSNINHVVLTGRLTSDPELRALPSGSSVCELRLAVNIRRRDASGEWGERPNFFDVVVYGGRGESVARHLHKGRPVAIDGRLDWREWETEDGRMAQAVRVVANTVQFLGGPTGSSNGSQPDELDGGDLHAIAGQDEESLDYADREAIAAAA